MTDQLSRIARPATVVLAILTSLAALFLIVDSVFISPEGGAFWIAGKVIIAINVLLHGALVLRGPKPSDWRDQLARWGSSLIVMSLGAGLVADAVIGGRGPDPEAWVAALGALLIVQGLLNFPWGKQVWPPPKSS